MAENEIFHVNIGQNIKFSDPCTVVGFKLSGPFKFFFVLINAKVTFLDANGPIK